ncbi:MAG: hypothetical protein EAZ51_07880 [Sphingobacteriales bacterium]|nr:MAG: hypothetical protein EAZ64_08470 [Sphingobacteriales bacterium]TAF79290.1 MAG: hypothetical protein EAZ51_07880 [Sphingobacteriales bacterium]
MIKYITFALTALLFACNSDIKITENPKPTTTKLPAPFKKHQKVEVGPGLIFDIFSWGRGADSTSSLLILKSDSLKNDFTIAETDNLDGKLSEVFNTDMDIDGYPEVIVVYQKNDKYKSAEVMCYEFLKDANKIRFPALSSKTKKQYRGNDKFYVKEGKLFREINLFDEADTINIKPISKKIVRYGLEGNGFTVNEVE